MVIIGFVIGLIVGVVIYGLYLQYVKRDAKDWN